jgi:hypothetical protein
VQVVLLIADVVDCLRWLNGHWVLTRSGCSYPVGSCPTIDYRRARGVHLSAPLLDFWSGLSPVWRQAPSYKSFAGAVGRVETTVASCGGVAGRPSKVSHLFSLR